MFKKNSSKALLTSVISIVLCCTMFLAATYAWFTSTAQSGINTVKTAGFDAALEYSTDFTTWTALSDTAVLFDNVVLAPGESSPVVYVRVRNANSYAIQGNVALGSISISDDNNDLLLRKKAGVTAAAALNTLDAGESLLNASSIVSGQTIAPGESYVVALAIELPTTATTPNVTATFVVTAGATQLGA